MSRIGKKPVAIPSGVKVSINDGIVEVVGPKSKLNMALPPMVSIDIDEANVLVKADDDSSKASALHGLARSLINNMVIGVSKGFKKQLTIIGVGYKAQVSGSKLTLNLGYSHVIEYQIPKGVTVIVADNTKLTIEGSDKQVVGEVAATIRRYRKPEPYKGKGIRYIDEHVIIKEGKTVG